MRTQKQTKIKPFLTWVGGKRWIMNSLLPLLPQSIHNYYEPFVGGGALFYRIYDKVNHSYLSDSNRNLMLAYSQVKNNPTEICKYLHGHMANNSKEYFLSLQAQPAFPDPIQESARFIYIVNNAFRGIYRTGKNGNLACSYKTESSKFHDKIILEPSSALQRADIACQSYNQIRPKRGDFVYFDPPYYTTGQVFGFYGLSQAFAEQGHINLRDFALSLTQQGVNVMISNSNTEFINALYSPYFAIHKIQALRFIGTQRTASELIMVNY